MNITQFHAYGKTTFRSEDIRAYGSLEALIESDILQGVPDREKSLSQLWEAANMVIDEKEEPQPETAYGSETGQPTTTDADNPQSDEPENEV